MYMLQGGMALHTVNAAVFFASMSALEMSPHCSLSVVAMGFVAFSLMIHPGRFVVYNVMSVMHSALFIL
jgi:hypothetical protein